MGPYSIFMLTDGQGQGLLHALNAKAEYCGGLRENYSGRGMNTDAARTGGKESGYLGAAREVRQVLVSGGGAKAWGALESRIMKTFLECEGLSRDAYSDGRDTYALRMQSEAFAYAHAADMIRSCV